MKTRTDLNGLKPPFFEDTSTELYAEDYEITFPLQREFSYNERMKGKIFSYTLDIEKLKEQLFFWNSNNNK